MGFLNETYHTRSRCTAFLIVECPDVLQIFMESNTLASADAVLLPLSCVNVQVCFESPLKKEALVTLSAVIGPFSCVNAQV